MLYLLAITNSTKKYATFSIADAMPSQNFLYSVSSWKNRWVSMSLSTCNRWSSQSSYFQTTARWNNFCNFIIQIIVHLRLHDFRSFEKNSCAICRLDSVNKGATHYSLKRTKFDTSSRVVDIVDVGYYASKHCCWNYNFFNDQGRMYYPVGAVGTGLWRQKNLLNFKKNLKENFQQKKIPKKISAVQPQRFVIIY